MIIVTINVDRFDKCMGEWYSDINVSRKESIFLTPCTDTNDYIKERCE